MQDKKGQGLSVETLIIALIALLVLVVIALIFTGQAGDFFDSIREFVSGTSAPDIDYTEVIE